MGLLVPQRMVVIPLMVGDPGILFQGVDGLEKLRTLVRTMSGLKNLCGSEERKVLSDQGDQSLAVRFVLERTIKVSAGELVMMTSFDQADICSKPSWTAKAATVK